MKKSLREILFQEEDKAFAILGGFTGFVAAAIAATYTVMSQSDSNFITTLWNMDHIWTDEGWLYMSTLFKNSAYIVPAGAAGGYVISKGIQVYDYIRDRIR